jgi:hypothetical protein
LNAPAAVAPPERSHILRSIPLQLGHVASDNGSSAVLGRNLSLESIMNTYAAAALSGPVEWELLPSLRNLLSRRRARSQPAWQDTLPSEMDVLMPSGPFQEVLPGLAVREVHEPDIFQIFFG